MFWHKLQIKFTFHARNRGTPPHPLSLAGSLFVYSSLIVAAARLAQRMLQSAWRAANLSQLCGKRKEATAAAKAKSIRATLTRTLKTRHGLISLWRTHSHTHAQRETLTTRQDGPTSCQSVCVCLCFSIRTMLFAIIVAKFVINVAILTALIPRVLQIDRL